MEELQIYIAIVNVVVLIVMAAFLAKNRDLKGRLFFAEQIQDTLRRRIKDCENACAILADARVVQSSKIDHLEKQVKRPYWETKRKYAENPTPPATTETSTKGVDSW